MLTRRIATSACALCLAVPAAAAARPAVNPPPTQGNRVVHVETRGDHTPGDAYSQLRRANALTGDGGTPGWRIAAAAEGTVLALLALGSVVIVRSRRNVHHIGF
jgi:hypothetical protein